MVKTNDTQAEPLLSDLDADWFARSLRQDAGAGREVEAQGKPLSEAGFDWTDPLAPMNCASDDDVSEDGGAPGTLVEKAAPGPAPGPTIVESRELLADPDPGPVLPEGNRSAADETWAFDDELSAPPTIVAGAEIFDFYPEDISTPPPSQEPRRSSGVADYPDVGEYRVRVDAALLADAFCDGASSRRPAIAERLRAILRDFPHASSRLAIERLAAAGIDLSTLEDLTDLKRLWRDDPGLWLMRRPMGLVLQSVQLRYALSWQLALRLHRAWPGDACAALEGDLLGRWLALPWRRVSELDRRSMAYLSFTSWLDAEAAMVVERNGIPDPLCLPSWDWLEHDDAAETARSCYRTDEGDRPFASLDASFWTGRAFGQTVPRPRADDEEDVT